MRKRPLPHDQFVIRLCLAGLVVALAAQWTGLV